jgi:hypothetical protein
MWRALIEPALLFVAPFEAYRRKAGIRLRDGRKRTVFHAIVETRAATGEEAH